jgi:2-amino-4-hydroxy-6-hydroxymethyldihydropteridine diphosphokinase
MPKSCSIKKGNLVYLGLGGNLGNPQETVQRAIQEIRNHPAFTHVRASRFYHTTPVSEIPQPSFINAVVELTTTASVKEVFEITQEIEQRLGKIEKNKNAPRIIDIDLLLFGEEGYESETLLVPHPRWRERLFVLQPLLDLTDQITCQEETVVLKEFLTHFSNPHQETVFPLEE